MDAFETATGKMGTKLTTIVRIGTPSSQLSLTKTTTGTAIVDPDAPEYQDYAKYFSHVDKHMTQTEELALHNIGPAETRAHT